ncbi:MAG: hypothetical protein IJB70_10530 [Clostridia bacterium]|nr:hypothetical protein [Clostridia bacterium]
MKKLLAIILTLAMAISAMPVFAEDVTVASDYFGFDDFTSTTYSASPANGELGSWSLYGYGQGTKAGILADTTVEGKGGTTAIKMTSGTNTTHPTQMRYTLNNAIDSYGAQIKVSCRLENALSSGTGFSVYANGTVLFNIRHTNYELSIAGSNVKDANGANAYFALNEWLDFTINLYFDGTYTATIVREDGTVYEKSGTHTYTNLTSLYFGYNYKQADTERIAYIDDITIAQLAEKTEEEPPVDNTKKDYFDFNEFESTSYTVMPENGNLGTWDRYGAGQSTKAGILSDSTVSGANGTALKLTTGSSTYPVQLRYVLTSPITTKGIRIKARINLETALATSTSYGIMLSDASSTSYNMLFSIAHTTHNMAIAGSQLKDSSGNVVAATLGEWFDVEIYYNCDKTYKLIVTKGDNTYVKTGTSTYGFFSNSVDAIGFGYANAQGGEKISYLDDIVVEDLNGAEGMTISDVTYSNGSADITNLEAGNITASALFSSDDGKDYNLTFYTAVYEVDENGEKTLLSVGVDSGVIKTSEHIFSNTVKVDNAENCVVKSFVWDSNMNPVRTFESLEK